MKLLVVGNGWSPHQAGGLNRYVTNLSRSVSDTDVEQQVLVLSPADDLRAEVRAVARSRDALWRRLLGFYREARRRMTVAEVVVGHFALNLLPVLLAAGRRPVVFHFHGPWSGESRSVGHSALNGTVKFLIEKIVFSRVNRFIVLSESFKDVLVSEYSVPPSKVEVIPPGVDVERFGGRGGTHRAGQFICVRRLVPRMGIDVLLRAWARVVGPEENLIIVGDGAERGRLEALAAELGLDGSVEFRGFVDDEELSALYGSSSASVIPTVELEGFGLVSLESLASGVPVIASRSGGLAEALAPFSPDWLVEPGDVDALSTALAKAIEAPSSLPTEPQCREWAQRFSWAATARRCVQQYGDVLAVTR